MPATLEAPVKPFVNDGVVNDPCCMGKTLDHVSFIINLASYTLQLKKFEGKDHIVVPVIMLTEGVHNGSDGPVFYPAEEISKFPASWNGVPVPLYHPEAAGFPISANSPEVLEAHSMGRVFSAQAIENGKKLKADLWLDVAKIQSLDPALLTKINSKQTVEVSTGLFFEADMTEGEWNGEKYSAIARNFRPDHLAILPTGKGACSVADGCGIRANTKVVVDKPVNTNNKSGGKKVDRKQRIEFLTANGYSFDEEAWEAIPDGVLEMMAAQVEKSVSANTALTSLQAEVETLKANAAKLPGSPEEFIAQAPADIQATLNRAMARDRQAKKDLVERLTKNQSVFTLAELEAKPLDELEKLGALTAPKDFSLKGGQTAPIMNVEEEPMEVPVFNFAKK